MKTKKEIFSLACNILIEKFEVAAKDIRPNSRLKDDLNIDSLSKIELTVDMAKELGFEMSDKFIKKAFTVNDIAEWFFVNQITVEIFAEIKRAIAQVGFGMPNVCQDVENIEPSETLRDDIGFDDCDMDEFGMILGIAEEHFESLRTVKDVINYLRPSRERRRRKTFEMVCDAFRKMANSENCSGISYENISPDSSLEGDIGMDYLDRAWLAGELEVTFNVRIDNDAVAGFKTVQDIVNHLCH